MHLGQTSTDLKKQNTAPTSDLLKGPFEAENSKVDEPCLDLTLAVGNEKTVTEEDTMVALENSSSEAEEGNGAFGTIF